MCTDLNGHFAVAVPALDGDHRQVILWNTTDANYLLGAGGLATAAAFDLFFGPAP